MVKKTEKKKKTITFNIVPNVERVILRLVQTTRAMSPILMPGQLKAGEALYTGEIVHPGNTKFKKGQIVYYSEYSAARLSNVGSVLREEQTLGSVFKTDYFVVAADDIMAFEKETFPFKKPEVVEPKPAVDISLPKGGVKQNGD